MEAHNKNALVSLSLTDEPIVVDVIRHSNQDKVKKVSSCKCGIIRLHKMLVWLISIRGKRILIAIYGLYVGTCMCRCEGEGILGRLVGDRVKKSESFDIA